MTSTAWSWRSYLLGGVLALGVVAWCGVSPACAEADDASLFYDELAQHGHWVQDPSHGPVWYPKQVKKQWRPYTDGRWVPSRQGYVFETREPWGWATYHYGNWMPSNKHGWVWKPGRTWYPHTCAWRQNDSHVGWAPMPPPEYFGGNDFSGQGDLTSGGGILGMLGESLWTFVQAANFLPGFGEQYSPSYSYLDSGYLATPALAPTIYQNTTVITHVVSPSYAPQAAYVWGPPTSYVSQVTNINQTAITNYMNNVNLTRINNVMADNIIMQRRPHLRQIMPPMGDRRGVSVQPAHLGNSGRLRLNRPDIAPRPADLPRIRHRLPTANVEVIPPRGHRQAQAQPGPVNPVPASTQPSRGWQWGRTGQGSPPAAGSPRHAAMVPASQASSHPRQFQGHGEMRPGAAPATTSTPGATPPQTRPSAPESGQPQQVRRPSPWQQVRQPQGPAPTEVAPPRQLPQPPETSARQSDLRRSRPSEPVRSQPLPQRPEQVRQPQDPRQLGPARQPQMPRQMDLSRQSPAQPQMEPVRQQQMQRQMEQARQQQMQSRQQPARPQPQVVAPAPTSPPPSSNQQDARNQNGKRHRPQ